jgi:hypothetical protein
MVGQAIHRIAQMMTGHPTSRNINYYIKRLLEAAQAAHARASGWILIRWDESQCQAMRAA